MAKSRVERGALVRRAPSARSWRSTVMKCPGGGWSTATEPCRRRTGAISSAACAPKASTSSRDGWSAGSREEFDDVGQRSSVLREEGVAPFVDPEVGAGDLRGDGVAVLGRCDAVEATGGDEGRTRDRGEAVPYV